MFKPGDRVRVIQIGRRRAIAIGSVIKDNRSEVDVEWKTRGEKVRTTFAHMAEYSGFKVLSRDPFTGGRCFSQRGPTYDLVEA